MFRLPDMLYRPLNRFMAAQGQIRRVENDRAIQAEDAAARIFYAELRQRHTVGRCGGVAAGCPYVPCVPRVT
jgi:hypothetical protein